MVKDGVNPDLLLGGKYGSKLHVWDLRRRRHIQEIDLGAEQQMVLELRPAHDPTRAYGFVGVVVSLKDLSSSIWVWYREGGDNGSKATWAVKKVIEIPAEPADPATLPPLLQGFKAVAPLVTDINLSLDDRFLYVSCWGTGEFIRATSAIHSSRRRSAPSASVASSVAPLTAKPVVHSTAARRWWRSAGTADAAKHQRPHTPWDISSIRMAFAVGW
jgi:hypothetical protein